MAFKVRGNCKVCITILQESPDDPTKSQLYKFIKDHQIGTKTVAGVARAYPDLMYLSIRNHSMKHQAISEHQLVKKKVAVQQKAIAKKAAIEGIKFSDAQQEILEAGMEALRNGDMKLTANVIAKIAKDIADIEAKKTDQAIELQKLFNTYVANPLPVTHGSKEWLEGEVVESDSPSSNI